MQFESILELKGYIFVDFLSGQQLSAGERTDRRLPHSVLQRIVLQDFRLQQGRSDAEVLQVCLHVR